MFEEILKKLNSDKSYDVKYRIIKCQNRTIGFIYLDFLTDSKKVNDIIFSIISFNQNEVSIENIYTHLMIASCEIEINLNKIVEKILKGEMAIILENEKQVIVVDSKSYPGRQIGEPDAEKVVRGSRDGFTETLSTNVALVRRRICDTDLIMENFIIGESSHTYVVLVYLKSRIDEKILNEVRTRLNQIETKELTMSDKALEEFLVKRPYSPFPLVKYTERPDTFSAHLYQGMFGILVDTSPSAILGPVSIFDHMQHAEEFRQTILAGSYLRLIRFFGIIIGNIILPFWFCLFLTNTIDINVSKNMLFFQIILIELAIEIVRMASIHTPSALSTSMGLIAGIVIGDMAVHLGVIAEEVAFLGCISALSSYITPSYELSLANKMVNLFLIILIYFFNFYGLIFGLIGLIIYLFALKSFTRSYLYPVIPFNFRALMKQIFRKPYIKNKKP